MAFHTRLSALARLSLAAAVLTGAGCNNDPGDGTLTISYTFGIGGSSCAAEGVNTIRVRFGDEEREETCQDEGEIILSGVPAGNYSDFVVEGIDAEGVTIRDNLDTPTGDEAVEVIGGSSTTIDVTLTPTPAQIQITFFLNDANGLQLPSLDASEIDEFEVAAAEGTNAALLVTSIDVGTLDSAQVIVPDPDRDLDGERLDTIVISYDGGSGEVQVDGDPDTMGTQPFTFDPPGDGRLVQILVTCNGADCSGELMGVTGGMVTGGGDSDTDDGDSATSG